MGVGKLTLIIKLLQTVIYIVNCVSGKSGNCVELVVHNPHLCFMYRTKLGEA